MPPSPGVAAGGAAGVIVIETVGTEIVEVAGRVTVGLQVKVPGAVGLAVAVGLGVGLVVFEAETVGVPLGVKLGLKVGVGLRVRLIVTVTEGVEVPVRVKLGLRVGV